MAILSNDGRFGVSVCGENNHMAIFFTHAPRKIDLLWKRQSTDLKDERQLTLSVNN